MKTPMRCCKKCGCYLPDNTTFCLACGYDESQKQEPASQPDTGIWYAFGECEPIRSSQIERLSTQYMFTGASDYQDPDAYYQLFTGDLYERPDYAHDGAAFYDLSTGHCYRFNAKTNTWVEIS